MQIDADSAYVLLQKLARKEVQQNRKNLERELAEWKAKCAKLSQRIGRYRATIRYLKSDEWIEARVRQAIEAATKAPDIEKEKMAIGLSLGDVIGPCLPRPQDLLDKASFEASKRAYEADRNQGLRNISVK